MSPVVEVEMEAENQPFHITLVGPGVNIEKDVDGVLLSQLLAVMFGTGPTIAAGNMSSATSVVPTSLREYLDEVGAKFKSDQIVAIGHYIALHEGRSTFSRDEVKARFAAAKEPMPSNFARDFSVAIKSGAIAEDHQKSGYYYVTKTGSRAVEQRFSNNG